jgi:hypothetical protein
MKKFTAEKLLIESVTVYNDRAEVKRVLECSTFPGFNPIVVEGLAPAVIGDSIRVEGRGLVTVHEVKFTEEYLHDNLATNKEVFLIDFF